MLHLKCAALVSFSIERKCIQVFRHQHKALWALAGILLGLQQYMHIFDFAGHFLLLVHIAEQRKPRGLETIFHNIARPHATAENTDHFFRVKKRSKSRFNAQAIFVALHYKQPRMRVEDELLTATAFAILFCYLQENKTFCRFTQNTRSLANTDAETAIGSWSTHCKEMTEIKILISELGFRMTVGLACVTDAHRLFATNTIPGGQILTHRK